MSNLTTSQTNISDAIKRHPELLNANEVIYDLQKRIFINNPHGAICSLQFNEQDLRERVEFSVSICKLYQKMYPRKHRNSIYPQFSPQMEREFYRVVSTMCFPIDFSPYEIYGDGWLYAFIPVRSIQKWDWLTVDFEFDELPLMFQLALALCHTHKDSSGCRNEHHKGFFTQFLKRYGLEDFPIVPSEDIDQRKLMDAYEDSNNECNALPLTLAFVNYKTHNIWLDAHPVMRAHLDFPWTEENLLRLAHDYKQAMILCMKIELFNDWLEKDPEENLRLSIMFWNSCKKESENLCPTI